MRTAPDRPGQPARRTAAVAGAVLAALLVLSSAPSAHGAGDPANDPQVREVAQKLTCYCGCSTQSIADCTCGVAQKERAAIQAQLADGQGPDAIVAGWVERHGPQILIEPPRRGFNLLGWFLPLGALMIAGVILALRLRHWGGRAPETVPAAPGSPEAPDPRYLEQLERELKRLEP